MPERAPERIAYGDDPSQFGLLHRPVSDPLGVVVVIHGGFWRARYDHSLGTPLAESLVAAGWAALNLEYRRVGNGGGAPATFDDVHGGLEHLAATDLPLRTVVTLGHSAGGHLAVWAAGRHRHDAWSPAVPVTHVIAQAGVLDLRTASRDRLGDGAVEAFLGHRPTEDDARFDPAQQVPLPQPVWCVHGTEDDVVPLTQSESYVAAARAAGGQAHLVAVPGDHFDVIDPASLAWERTLAVLDTIPADGRS